MSDIRFDDDYEDAMVVDDASDSDASTFSDEDDDDNVSNHGPTLDDNPMDTVLAPTTSTSASNAGQTPMLDISATDLMQLDSALDLQTDALLAETRFAVPAHVRAALVSVKSALEAGSATPSLSFDEASKHLRKRKVAWPWNVAIGAKEAVNYSFGYAPPARVDVVGSFLVGGESKGGALVKRRGGGFNLDLAVQMPSALFQAKDHLNHRYFHKRAFYLAHAASLLQPLGHALTFTYDRGDPRKPLLLVTIPLNAKKPRGPAATIVVRPAIDSALFPATKLAPSRNNVRPGATDPAVADPLPPTPRYNAQLLADAHLLQHLQTMHRAAVMVPALPAAMRLIKIWAEQKGLGEWGFPLSYAAAALALRGDVGRDLKPSHIFRTIVFWAANQDWSRPVVVAEKGTVSLAEWEGVAEVAIVDREGGNVAWWAGIADANRLKIEAEHAASLAAASEFMPIFLAPSLASVAKYDQLVQIPIPATPPPFYNPRVRLDDPCLQLFLHRAVPRLLARALTDRVRLIAAVPRVSITTSPAVAGSTGSSWSVATAAPATSAIVSDDGKASEMVIGLHLHPANYSRAVDVGPSPEIDAAGAGDFRRLWGTKAELRRFPDGSIAESVTWPGIAPSKVVASAIDYVVARHMKVTPAQHWSQHAVLKQLRALDRTAAAGHSPAVSSVDVAFAQLSRIIRDLDDSMPLPATTILPVSPELTKTAIAPHRAPATFVVELEASGKWPTEPEPLYHMTALFLSQYADLLDSQPGVARTTVVTAPLSLDLEYVGHCFRMILKPKHAPALRPEMNHANDVLNLALAFPAYAPAARLLKFFIARHMLGYQIHDHISELLAAHVFTTSATSAHARPPVDALSAFVRILEVIGTVDWSRETLAVRTRVAGSDGAASAASVRDNAPTAVPLGSTADAAAKLNKEAAATEDNDDPSATHVRRVQGTIDAAPPATPGTAVVASAYRRHPIELLAVKRLRAVAKAALAFLVPRPLVSDLPAVPTKKPLEPLFAGSLDHFDMVLPLRADVVKKYVVRGSSIPSTSSIGGSESRPGFLPVDCWIQDVAARYGSLCRLFFNDVDGAAVGVLFDPMVLVPKRLDLSPEALAESINAKFIRVQSSNDQEDAMETDGDEDGNITYLMAPNVPAIAGELVRMGEGIVDRAVIQRLELAMLDDTPAVSDDNDDEDSSDDE
ncbi:Nrap protein-domain-containing protein [Blastocladiella britannica]|nr:Nrap protein-domain-containing protein [Blastocladiella britannica]